MASTVHIPIHRRVLAALLIVAFVLQPTAIAALPCSTLGAIFPLACCCTEASAAKIQVAPERSCCEAQLEIAGTARGPVVLSGGGDCGCRLILRDEAQRASPIGGPHGLGAASSTEIGSWLELGAVCSAVVCVSERDAIAFAHGAAPPAPDDSGPPPASGCARHAIVQRGAQALLTAYCIALL